MSRRIAPWALWAAALVLALVAALLLWPVLSESIAAAPAPATSEPPTVSETGIGEPLATDPPSPLSSPTTSPTPASSPRASGPSDGGLGVSASEPALEQMLRASVSGVTEDPAAVEAGWSLLSADLSAGGWHDLHRLAAVARPDQAASSSTRQVVEVLTFWTGTRPVTGPSDRQLTSIRLAHTAQGWSVLAIT